MITCACIVRGEALPGEDHLLKDLPQGLQEDVGMEEFFPLLSNVKFFKNTDTAFLRQLTLYTHTHLFAPGDMIVYYGDIGTEMYCIRKGYVEVHCTTVHVKSIAHVLYMYLCALKHV